MFTLNKKVLTEDAKYIEDIIKHYSDKEHIKKLISPISDEYFLIDETNEIYICIGDGKVTLSNHIFLYKKLFKLSFTDHLKKQVKENMEQEMQALKKSLFKNETDLLSKVLDLANANKKPHVISPNFKSISK